MLLTCDIGNSTITVGLFAGEELTAHGRLSSDLSRTEEEYRAGLRDLLQTLGHGWTDISGAILCSVVPALTARFQRVLETDGPGPPILVHHALDLGLRLDHYPRPEEIGADRLVNASAAYARYRRSVIVVDLGTATTFDVVSRDGDFLGGAIAPGLGIGAEALVSRTAKLPRVELHTPKTAIGQDTTASMQSGIVYGYAGLIDGLVSRFQQELPHQALVIATGGHSGLLAPLCRSVSQHRPHLTLEGLAGLYRRCRN
jgi:type III pantothenate kinase